MFVDHFDIFKLFLLLTVHPTTIHQDARETIQAVQEAE